MKPCVVLENIRSAYNVGNIVRTCDALGWDIAIVGYTPHPLFHPKVEKSALWAQHNIHISSYPDSQSAYDFFDQQWCTQVAGECGYLQCISLQDPLVSALPSELVLWLGNEVEGVSPPILKQMKHIIAIPMHGIKASLNVWQAAAILMRELIHGRGLAQDPQQDPQTTDHQ